MERRAWGRAKTCCWCNITVSYYKVPKGTRPRETAATREHIVPQADGGANGSNVRVACYRCNNARNRALDWILYADQPRDLRRTGQPMRLGDLPPGVTVSPIRLNPLDAL